MFEQHDTTHPAKAELRRLLTLVAPEYGLPAAGVDELVRTAKIVRGLHTVASSDDEDGLANFVIRGPVRVELVDRRLSEPAICGVIGPGEFCCLARLSDRRTYHVRAVAHGPRGEAILVTLAIWGAEAILGLVRIMSPRDVVGLLAATRRLQARQTFDARMMLELKLPERLMLVVRDLAARFGVPHPDGILVDVPLSDGSLARLVGATRAPVNRAIHHVLEPHRLLRREGRESLVLLNAPAKPRPRLVARTAAPANPTEAS